MKFFFRPLILITLAALAALLPAAARAQDSDSDGLPDAYEAAHGCLMANTVDAGADPDADTLTSLQEYLFSTRLDPCWADSDRDGAEDGAEVDAGGNPLDARVLATLHTLGETRVTYSSTSSNKSTVVWTGSEFALSWLENGRVFFSRLDAAGAKIGAEFQIVNSSRESSPGLAFTGSEFAVSAGDLVLIGLDGSTTSAGEYYYYETFTRPVWTGTGFATLSYRGDFGYDAYLVIFDALGNIAAAPELPVRYSHAPDHGLAWTGSEFGYAFLGGFQRLTAAGAPIGSNYLMSPIGDPLEVSLAYAGGLFAELQGWDNGSFELVLFDDQGQVVRDRVMSGLIATPILAAGSGFMFASHEAVWGAPTRLWWLDAQGRSLAGPGQAPPFSTDSVVWTGSEFGMAGSSYFGNNYEIVFTRLEPDTDGDGLYLSEETTAGTNPADWDTDNDRVPDGLELNGTCGMDPLVTDTTSDADSDGLANSDDYEGGGDPCDSDTDDDGLDDFEEIVTHGTNPAAADTDGDSLPDYDEVVTHLTDPTAADTDDDGLPDDWEVAHLGCGLDPNVVDYGYDPDGDILINLDEFAAGSNPCDPDTDDDTLTDGQEVHTYMTDPSLADTDRDGIDDAAEIPLGTSPILSDTDDDLVGDGMELWQGAAPLDSRIFPRYQHEDFALSPAQYAYNSDLVWTGSEFGLVASTADGILYARVSATGSLIGSPVGLSSSTNADPQIMTAGTNLIICVWNCQYWASLLPDGTVVTPMTDMGYQMDSLAWTGSELAVAYDVQFGSTGEVVFRRYSNTLGPLADEVRVTTGVGPSLAWNGANFGLAWTIWLSEGFGDIHFSELSPTGVKLGSEWTMPTIYHWGLSPSLLWNGTDYALTYSDYLLYPPNQGYPQEALFYVGPTGIQEPGYIFTSLGDGLRWRPDRYFAIGINQSAWLVEMDRETRNYAAPLSIPQSASDLAAAWTGSEYGIAWITHDVNYTNDNRLMFSVVRPDYDGDGLLDTAEPAAGTLANDWDTDDDLLPDGWEVTYAACGLSPLTPDAAADPDLDGLTNLQEYNAGGSPCLTDTDADGTDDPLDCDPADPNAWTKCATCIDDDLDGHYGECDVYVTVTGPDCDDGNDHTWDTCATCMDADGDNWWGVCNLYTYPEMINVNNLPDCDDANTNVWQQCVVCHDADGDGRWTAGCDRYLTIVGGDCNDANPHAWDTCATCVDSDGDTWYGTCNDYTGINGPDCSDANTFAWSTCATCLDPDADGWFGICDRYQTPAGILLGIGSGTNTTNIPLATNYLTYRSQIIYLASEIGKAGTISSLALDVAGVPGQAMNNFTIRLKHTTLAEHTTLSWEGPASGWTTVYQTNQTVTATGWVTFTFTTPFVYNGTDNLMVDISFRNTNSSTTGTVRHTSATGYRGIYFRTSSDYGDPLAWTGTTNPSPVGWTNILNVKLNFPDAFYSINSPDCAPADPNHWSDCGLCVDVDGDFRGENCNRGPDCNDLDPHAWNTCATCVDADADGWRGVCNDYTGINGPDCNDGNPNTWNTCATCLDTDGDGWFFGCNVYTTVSGPDCNNGNPNTWNTCATCLDTDADGWYVGCNVYTTVSGPDCSDANTYAWNACATCADSDGDGYYSGCDRYAGPPVSFVDIGTGTSSNSLPLSTNYQDTRMETVYPAALIGRSGGISSLALYVATVPGRVMENFTIRLQHTTLSNHADRTWQGPDSGWTTVYQANEPPGTTGWHTFNFTTPFFYDGVSNLLVDISYNNSATAGAGQVRYSSSSNASIYFRTESAYGDPLQWTGTSNPTPSIWAYYPNLRLGFQQIKGGPDCAPDDPDHWYDCGKCVDYDEDDHGDFCDLGSDCMEDNLNCWDTCATCWDSDNDGWYVACNRYIGIKGGDCSDWQPTVNPGATEVICSGYDDDCNPSTPDNMDQDGDGLLLCSENNISTSDLLPDSDFGCELDSFEAAAGRNPLSPLDDICLPGSTVTTGTGTSTWTLPFATNYHDARTQVIYLASEIGRSGMIASLALDVSTVPGQVMNNFTIRLKHTSLPYYSNTDWESSGLVTVYQNAAEPVGATGWRNFTFTTPFPYNGVDNLVVDISFNNSSYTTTGYVRYTVPAVDRAMSRRTNSTDGDPLTWSGGGPAATLSPALPNLKLSFTGSALVDADSDGMADGFEAQYAACLAGNSLPTDDPDGDGLTNLAEYQHATSPCDPDTDNDGMPDGWEINVSPCLLDPHANDAGYNSDGDDLNNLAEYILGTDPCVWNSVDPDGDSDGLTWIEEIAIGTNPNVADSDQDGINDGQEYLSLGTNPLGWDTDTDGLPDGFEVANLTGHDDNLDPLDSADGAADFDGDGITNAHEYWNSTSLWAANPAGFVECGYWGEADNDGFITGNDRDVLLSAAIGNPTDYASVFPPTGETQDLDGDGWYTGNDVDLLNAMMIGADTPLIQSRPAALEAIDTCAPTLAVGDTCHVSVAVLNSMTPTAGRQAGIAVVFTVDPSSTGSATIFGGEGAGDLGAGRYDLSSSALSSPAGVSRAVVRADSAGTVKITARVPQCGTEVGVGRSSSEIVLPTFATVTVP